MCGYFCIGFIDFMLKDNNLTDFIKNFKKQVIQDIFTEMN